MQASGSSHPAEAVHADAAQPSVGVRMLPSSRRDASPASGSSLRPPNIPAAVVPGGQRRHRTTLSLPSGPLFGPGTRADLSAAGSAPATCIARPLPADHAPPAGSPNCLRRPCRLLPQHLLRGCPTVQRRTKAARSLRTLAAGLGRASRIISNHLESAPAHPFEINALRNSIVSTAGNPSNLLEKTAGKRTGRGAVLQRLRKEGAVTDIRHVAQDSERSSIGRKLRGERGMRYCWEDFSFERQGALLTRRGAQVAVSRKVLDCIHHLIEQRHRVVSCDELILAIWGHTAVSNNQLSQIVLSTRRSIGDDGHAQRLIRTVSGIGYRWIGEVDASMGAPSHEDRARAGTAANPAHAGTQVVGMPDRFHARRDQNAYLLSAQTWPMVATVVMSGAGGWPSAIGGQTREAHMQFQGRTSAGR